MPDIYFKTLNFTKILSCLRERYFMMPGEKSDFLMLKSLWLLAWNLKAWWEVIVLLGVLFSNLCETAFQKLFCAFSKVFISGRQMNSVNTVLGAGIHHWQLESPSFNLLHAGWSFCLPVTHHVIGIEFWIPLHGKGEVPSSLPVQQSAFQAHSLKAAKWGQGRENTR